MKKFFALSFCTLFFIANLHAFDISFTLTPSVLVPSQEKMGTGFAGFARAEADLFGFLTAGIEGNTALSTPEGLDDNVFAGGAGLSLGAYFFPLSRLYLGLGGAGGIYQLNLKIDGQNESWSDLYYRGYGDIGFRFSPNWTLSATGGYVSYLTSDSDEILSGPFVGLSIKFTANVGKKGSSSFTSSFEQDSYALPLFMSTYRQYPIGTVSLRNNEGGEIRNVKVSFRAGKYTASTLEVASFGYVKKYGSVDIPLTADFSSEVLRFSENGKISGEIVVDYEFLGKKGQSIQTVVIDMLNRNSFFWADESALAAFVSPDTPEIQEFAKYVAGIARNNYATGMNRNLVTAAALYNSLVLAGVKLQEDKSSPYLTSHKSDAVDSIQYPLQTLSYLSGDMDEIGVLLASCLETVGVPSGILCTNDDFLVLVGMQVKSGSEGNHFGNPEGVISDEFDVYFGLSMKEFGKSFTQSRKTAEKQIAFVKSDEENEYTFTDVHTSWEVYPPTVYSGIGNHIVTPSQSVLDKAVKTSISEYIDGDLSVVISRAKKAGDPNKLGLAYLRAGRLSEAKTEFQKSTSLSSMNNLANVYMLEKNYSQAAAQYKRVLEKDSSNRIAQKGLENANTKLGL
ncbi:MAG: hypothetical protein IJ630_12695 [Treponema sp.]|nr:hypothetical protein [Treponema sp.]